MRIIFFLCILKSTTLLSQDFGEIRVNLEEINVESLKLRSQVLPTIKEFGVDSQEKKELDRQIIKFDSIALGYTITVIEKHGWLGKSEIGKLANQTLFVVIQHAEDPQIRKTYYPFLEASVKIS